MPLRDDAKCQVDAGGDSGGCEDRTLVDHVLVSHNDDRRISVSHPVEGLPVRRRPSAFEKAGLSEQKRAGAHRYGEHSAGRLAANPLDCGFIVHQSSRSPAARHDQ